MNILNDQGLVIQGAGSGNLNYAVTHISKTLTFTYSSGLTNILTITASNSAPTNLVICYYYTWAAENTSSGAQVNYAFESYKLLSTGYWSQTNQTTINGYGQAWQTQSTDYSAQRIIKLQSQGNNATYPNLSCTYHLMVASSDFSYLNFS